MVMKLNYGQCQFHVHICQMEQKVAEVIQKNLADVGIQSKIVSYEWATYLEKARKGEADAFILGWTGDNGDADNFIYTIT